MLGETAVDFPQARHARTVGEEIMLRCPSGSEHDTGQGGNKVIRPRRSQLAGNSGAGLEEGGRVASSSIVSAGRGAPASLGQLSAEGLHDEKVVMDHPVKPVATWNDSFGLRELQKLVFTENGDLSPTD